MYRQASRVMEVISRSPASCSVGRSSPRPQDMAQGESGCWRFVDRRLGGRRGPDFLIPLLAPGTEDIRVRRNLAVQWVVESDRNYPIASAFECGSSFGVPFVPTPPIVVAAVNEDTDLWGGNIPSASGRPVIGKPGRPNPGSGAQTLCLESRWSPRLLADQGVLS